MIFHKVIHQLRDLPYSLLLVGVHPVISLYAHNISQLEVSYLVRPLLFSLAYVFLCYIIARIITRKCTISVILADFLVLITFAFGIIRDYGRLYPLFGFKWGAFPVSIPLWSVITITGVWLIVKKLKNSSTLIPLVNIVSLALLILPTYQIFNYNWQRGFAQQSHFSLIKPDIAIDETPDIYLIIVDAYSRADVLKDELDFDNSPFVEELEKTGFYVASCSNSNYSVTTLQIAALMNLDYHKELSEGEVIEQFVPAIRNLIADNFVQEYLKEHGYQIVSFHNNFSFLNLPASDVYYDFREEYHFLTPFETMLLEKTPLGSIIFQANIIPTFKYFPKYVYDNYVLDTLEIIPSSLESPKFVYAHLLVTHPPYIIGENGEYIGNHVSDDYANQKGYTDQITFLNKRLLTIISHILSESEIPPIILIQSDHGEFYAPVDIHQTVFNALYLPEISTTTLYSSLSPINTFRLVFNLYFEESFSLLPDISYYLQEVPGSSNERTLQLYQSARPNCDTQGK